jgi:hypothetical protein
VLKFKGSRARTKVFVLVFSEKYLVLVSGRSTVQRSGDRRPLENLVFAFFLPESEKIRFVLPQIGFENYIFSMIATPLLNLWIRHRCVSYYLFVFQPYSSYFGENSQQKKKTNIKVSENLPRRMSYLRYYYKICLSIMSLFLIDIMQSMYIFFIKCILHKR